MLIIFAVGRGGPMGGPGGPGGLQGGRGDGKMEVFFSVPANKCGLVIGKGKKNFFLV